MIVDPLESCDGKTDKMLLHAVTNPTSSLTQHLARLAITSGTSKAFCRFLILNSVAEEIFNEKNIGR